VTASGETAVRNYLAVLRDPFALRDDDNIEELRRQLDSAEDELQRLQLRQQILDSESPSVERYEDEFVTHAKSWADQHGISSKAFEAEGVPGGVLRKAGFAGVGRGGRPRGGTTGGRGRGAGAAGRTRSRVTVDEVRAAIPKGAFTLKRLQELSGASPAVVRKVVQSELASGGITEEGPDPDHRGPGRAPTLHKRA
jgi:hypothetical protein